MEQIERLFDHYGRLRDVKLMRDFGFVEFEHSRDAEDALRALDGHAVCSLRSSSAELDLILFTFCITCSCCLASTHTCPFAALMSMGNAFLLNGPAIIVVAVIVIETMTTTMAVIVEMVVIVVAGAIVIAVLHQNASMNDLASSSVLFFSVFAPDGLMLLFSLSRTRSNCGQMGHIARDCPNGNWKNRCYLCGAEGHISRNCTAKRSALLWLIQLFIL